MHAYQLFCTIINTHTFLDLFGTAYIGIKSVVFGEGVEPSKERLMENRPE